MLPFSEKLYICPGESHPVSRSVHLARLASFYPACRDCPFRTETGQLPPQTIERLQSTERRVERKSLFTAEGVRGVHLNELTRTKAGQFAAALAGLLWDEAPLVGRGDGGQRGSRRARPAVVVGHDERPSSPDIVTGVTAALRRMGCQVIDVGLTTRPCFWFAVDHLEASAGVLVTGAGCPPSWTGLDFVGRGGMPLSQGAGLERIERRLSHPESRPTRQAGPHRTFQASVPYEAGLWKHFHALRPLKVCYGSPTRLVRKTLERIFETLPCRLIAVEVPSRARNVADPQDVDVVRLGEAVRRRQADLGVLIDDDGQRCGFVDEQGRLVPAVDVTRILAGLLLTEHPQGTAVIETAGLDPLRPTVEERGGRGLDGGRTLTDLSQAMRDGGAVFGGGTSGRWWFRETFPACDAVLTLAKLLDALSRSDAPFSEVVASD